MVTSLRRLITLSVLLTSLPVWAKTNSLLADQYHQSNSHSRRQQSLEIYKDKPHSVTLGKWYVGAGTGISVPHVNTNTYGYAPVGTGFPNDQYVRNSTQTEPLISLLAGYRFATQQIWFPFFSVGATYSYIFNSKVTGVINQFSNPAFKNYNYQYEIQRQTLMGILKADVYQWNFILPYVTGGLGFSRNNVQSYSEQALPGVTPRVSPGFGSQVNWYGSWMLGAGLDIEFNDAIWANLEYNYGHYGDAQTGPGSVNAGTPGANFSNSSLKTQLTASTFAANVMYFFDV